MQISNFYYYAVAMCSYNWSVVLEKVKHLGALVASNFVTMLVVSRDVNLK